MIRHIYQVLAGYLLQLRGLYRRELHPILSPAYAIAAALGVAVFVYEQGFFPAVGSEALHTRVLIVLFRGIIAYLYVYEALSYSLAFEGGWRARVRSRRLQLAILVLVPLVHVYRETVFAFLGFPTAGSYFFALRVGLCLLLFGAAAHLLRRLRFMELGRLNPSLVFLLSFAGVILAGFLLLSLPRLHTSALASVDALFIAVSAVCVTGLTTVDINEAFTFSGQVVVLVLIQIGGLGLMTLTTFFAYFLTGRASVSTRLLMSDLFSEESVGRVKTIVKNIGLVTLAIEAAGAVLLYVSMPSSLYSEPGQRMFQAIFQAVSAFCNAGFSLHAASLGPAVFEPASGQLYVSVHMLLIVLGGLGFPVIVELARLALERKNPYARLALSTRLVLVVNAALWSVGAVGYLLLEHEHTLGSLAWGDRLWHSLFYSVTMRTAGFNTLPVSEVGAATAFFTLLFMWIGASPMSTGGGIKTTTFGLAVLHILDVVQGKGRVEVFHKTVGSASVNRAFAVVVLSLTFIFAGVFLLVMIEPFPFLDIAFETVSAFGTVGLSRGITTELSTAGKLILCVLMLCGRVGVLSVLIALTPKEGRAGRTYRYPEEHVVVG